MRSEGKNKAYAAASVTAVIFGFSFLFTKSALDYLDTFQLLSFRFLAAAVFLGLLKLAGIIRVDLKGKKLGPLLVVALFQPVLYFSFETLGVGMTTASESSIIISIIPIPVTLLAAFMLKERLSALQWFSVSLSVAGVVIIILSKSGEGGGSGMLGIAALLCAVAAGSFYNVFSRKVSSDFAPIETTFIMMWVGAVVFTAAGLSSALFRGNIADFFTGIANPGVIAGIFYLGVISSVAAFFLMNYSLSKLEASKSAVFLNLVPVISVAAGITMRGEKLGMLQFVGSVVILAGIWGANRVKKTAGAGLPEEMNYEETAL